jgi:AraC-like DNA-binding protein
MLYQIPVAAYLTGAGSDEVIEDGKNSLAALWGKPDRLAEQATLPLRTFLRQFHAVTGRAPFVYLHDLRLHHAMLELKRTKRHITDVALGAGFNDLSFFNRKFKLVAGLPPTIWRQKRPHEW